MISLRVISLLAATLLAAPTPVADNFVPDVYPSLSGAGGIGPLQETRVRLVSERLRLVPAASGLWQARAEYVLANDGPAKQVLYGVPTNWRRFEFLGRPPRPPDEILEGAKAFHIDLAGKGYACEPVLARPAPPVGNKRAVEAWCMTHLEIPPGRSTLTLEYTAYASEMGEPARAEPAHLLDYTLAPAGYWRGPVEDVVIEIDPRDVGGRVKVVWPPGASEEGGLIRWHATDVDLKKVGSVVLDYGMRQHPEWAGGGWLRAPARLEATASSFLPRNGAFVYSAAKAVDGDAGTAWCEGAPGDGIGENLSVTVKAEVPPGAECRVLDVELAPGLAKNDAAYRANGRPSAGRLERCDVAAPPTAFSLIRDASVGENTPAWAAKSVIAFGEGALRDGAACVRLVITDVWRGTKYRDTCVSEFVPRVYCRAVPAK